VETPLRREKMVATRFTLVPQSMIRGMLRKEPFLRDLCIGKNECCVWVVWRAGGILAEESWTINLEGPTLSLICLAAFPSITCIHTQSCDARICRLTPNERLQFSIRRSGTDD
jgi:hypothetical protein